MIGCNVQNLMFSVKSKVIVLRLALIRMKVEADLIAQIFTFFYYEFQ